MIQQHNLSSDFGSKRREKPPCCVRNKEINGLRGGLIFFFLFGSEERPKSMDHELYNNKPQARGVRAIMVATGCEWSQKDTRCTVAQCGSGQSAVDERERERRDRSPTTMELTRYYLLCCSKVRGLVIMRTIRSSMITGSHQLKKKKKKSQSATPHLWVIRASRQIAIRPYNMLKDR
ncbi:hypothetical protein BO85DRAFT_198204 [Aspergillus piperis CBS 112811]|uniref:Uncharacterized protein n=1 Tax=Aspergillus piperis CBS 112811 TaxID=1448313 RepID=A0A8G1QS13_9EURO|nr:hypothetical protein BO85DRAFT_198204 [Aspergillus piperis CBS 112811]RAH52554.1 hypothetical protein BO85DRAFT_198204 [Aspergillus piperis CBS 112811]